jgi:hypothetical protein
LILSISPHEEFLVPKNDPEISDIFAKMILGFRSSANGRPNSERAFGAINNMRIRTISPRNACLI